ncbi:MAG: hypothetical protein P9X26_04510, partial [Candidatus Stygibacter frigidus]|nr:hypothetical protein [Candidatus Stygibacter frigidus]
GYTLRLIREEISAEYKIELNKLLENIKIAKGEIKPGEALAHPIFVEPLLKYIIDDLQHSRLMYGDHTIGGMVVCDSSDQAKMLFEIFNEQYTAESRKHIDEQKGIQRESSKRKKECEVTTAALILYDIGTKEDREDWVINFKAGNIDILFVYNMLLTGFDAPRLKKMYLGRRIKSHSLLQALTRVNRTYKNHRYGYVVDFVNIKPQFDITNKEYLEELHSELGDEIESYSNLFKSKEEMEAEIAEIKQILCSYNIENAEEFSRQINQIEDRKKILELKKVLLNAKELYNIIRLLGHYELLELLDFNKLNDLYKETANRLSLLSDKEALENSHDGTNILNIAIEDVIFEFIKIGEEELLIADELKNTLSRTREAMLHNYDKKDPEFITLYEELKRIFKQKKLDEVTQDEMRRNISTLNRIYARIKELNRLNNLLKSKYDGDPKYVRIHKRITMKGALSKNELKVFEALKAIKEMADEQVLKNSRLMKNEKYFDGEMMLLVIDQLKNKSKFDLDIESLKYINTLVVKEYLDEFNGRSYYGSTI